MNRDGAAGPGAAPFRVCFVCTGNICRSPVAAAIFAKLVNDAGLGDRIAVSSAGTGRWHVGEAADARALTSLDEHGYNGDAHRARQFDPSWFGELDLIVALDRSHEKALRSLAATEADRSKIRLLLDFDGQPGAEVPDPYDADAEMFATVLTMIERACNALFHQLEPARRQGATP